MDEKFRDYTEFLGVVVMFRAARDMDNNQLCSIGPDPELWLDIRLDNLASDKEMDPETKEWLIIASKVAELLDDRKQWLIDEIDEDLRVAVDNLRTSDAGRPFLND